MLERARLRDAERDLAAEVQRGLLPKELAQSPELVSTARYLPATDGMQVGGDWYEIIRLPADRFGLVIGDVQGHNVHAASTMGQLRNALRAYAAEGHDAAAVLSRSNRLMADIDPGAFATCCYVEVDLRRGLAFVVRAGHPPPLLRSAGGAARLLDVAIGLPLGVDPDETYVAEPVYLSAGDTLVLYTDGLVEDSRTPLDAGLEIFAAAVSAGETGDLEAFADGDSTTTLWRRRPRRGSRIPCRRTRSICCVAAFSALEIAAPPRSRARRKDWPCRRPAQRRRASW